MTGNRNRLIWVCLFMLGQVALVANSPAQDASIQLDPLPEMELESMAEPVREALVEARERVEAVAAEDGNDVALAEAYGHFADVSLAHDLTPQARVAYRNALALRPDRQEWHYLLALLEISDGDLEESIASLNRAIELYPRDYVALVRRGRVYLELGDFDRAEADFERAQQLGPESAAVLAGLGRSALQQGDHEEAVEYLEAALERAPSANGLHQSLGMAYRGLGESEKAREHLSQGGEVRESVRDPVLDRINRLSRSPQFYLETGLVQAERGNMADAARLLERARELDPDSDRILRELGEVKARLGDFDAAREAFSELVGRSTVEAEDYYLLGQAEELRGRFDAAIDAYEEALSIDADYTDARESIAFALFNRGDTEAAAERFARLAEQRSEPAERSRFIYWQAIVHLAEGRCRKAAADLDQARDITEDNNADVLTALARMRATCLDADEAELDEALEWAAALYDAAPGIESAATRAMIHAARGEFDDAVDFQTQAVFEALKRFGDLEGRPDLREEMERYREQQPAQRPFGSAHPVFSPGMSGN